MSAATCSRPRSFRPEAAAALEGWDVVRRNVASGDGHTDEVIRIKRWNKVEALKLLAQRFGLFDERTQLGGRIEIAWKDEILDGLEQGRKRVANARQGEEVLTAPGASPPDRVRPRASSAMNPMRREARSDAAAKRYAERREILRKALRW